jgi:hypothetical protein
MAIKTGDKVRFLNDIGGGVVTQILGGNKILVKRSDGFEIPVMLNEVVWDGGENLYEKKAFVSHNGKALQDFDRDDEEYENEANENFEEEGEEITTLELIKQAKEIQTADKKEEKPQPSVVEDEFTTDTTRKIFFALVPQKKGNNSTFDAYIINDSTFRLLFNLVQKKEDLFYPIKNGMLEPDTKEFICTYSRDEVNKFLHLTLQVIFYKQHIYEPVLPIQRIIEIKPTELFRENAIAENDFFDEHAFLLPVEDSSIEDSINNLKPTQLKDIVKEKEQNETVKSVARDQQTANQMPEIDLHIEKICDDFKGLTPKDIIEMQLNKFRDELQKAIETKHKRIVFIHGLGNGKLKFELRKYLDEKHPKLQYHDASFKEYGFGATMVYLKTH